MNFNVTDKKCFASSQNNAGKETRKGKKEAKQSKSCVFFQTRPTYKNYAKRLKLLAAKNLHITNV